MEGEGIVHRVVEVNGIKMHVAEKGEGPVVLFVHGFPELWYSWRHQILSLAAHGYRAIAPDLRGYGDTEAPTDVAAYSIFHLVGDVIALIDSLGQEKVFVVGHDWGAIVAWNLCAFRPDKVRALVNLSVPFISRNRVPLWSDVLKAIFAIDFYIFRFQVINSIIKYIYNYLKAFVVGHDWGAIVARNLCVFRLVKFKTLANLSQSFLTRIRVPFRTDVLRAIYGDDFYICRFQEIGEVEAQLDQIDTILLMKSFLAYANSSHPLIIPKDNGRFTELFSKEAILPNWLSEDDILYYASKFTKTGFAGGINYYRNIDKNWELSAPWADIEIKVPTKFIVGDVDLVYHMVGMKEYIHNGGFKRDVPMLEEVVVMEGVGHFINQERPEEISNYIYEFIQKF